MPSGTPPDTTQDRSVLRGRPGTKVDSSCHVGTALTWRSGSCSERGHRVLPQTWAQIAVVLAAVMPGFIYQVSRRKVGGPDPDEIELGTRILRAIAVSALFAGIYAIVFGPMVARYAADPDRLLMGLRQVAVTFLIIVVIVPWLSARVVFYVTTSRWYATMAEQVSTTLHLKRTWDPTPSAWDFAFSAVGPGWVRILTADGTWLGGWFADGSFASSFPNPQEIFVEVGYLLDGDGNFTNQITAPGGVFIRCADAVSVDFIPTEEDNDNDDRGDDDATEPEEGDVDE